MTQQEFEDTLRQFLRREPFQPFVAELPTGRSIDIDAPTIAFGGDEAGFITANKDVRFFACENVRGIDNPARLAFA